MIENPTPITPGTFSGMWITSLAIFCSNAGRTDARFLPFDGSHLLATGGKQTPNLAKLADADLAAVVAEAKRVSGKTAEPHIITVNAPDPAQPVLCTIIFKDNTIHRIRDCYALAGTDPVFAAAFTSVMDAVATLAGLTVA